MEVKTTTEKTTVITVSADDILAILVEKFAKDKNASASFLDTYDDTIYPSYVSITFKEVSET